MKRYTELPITIADLEAAPELYVSAPSLFSHQSILTEIAVAVFGYLGENPIGSVPGVGVVFDDFNGVIPDLVFLTNERLNKIP